MAALIGIRQEVNYEEQAAIELEMTIVASEEEAAYPLELVPDGDRWIIGTQCLFEALLDVLDRSLPVAAISRRFHNGLVEGFAQLAMLLRKIHHVCLSGGTFHNIYLSQRLEARLSQAGFEVFMQKEMPSGDSALSLGHELWTCAQTRFQLRSAAEACQHPMSFPSSRAYRDFHSVDMRGLPRSQSSSFSLRAPTPVPRARGPGRKIRFPARRPRQWRPG